MPTQTFVITEEQRRQYREQGFMILEKAMSQEQIDLLRDECAHAIESIHAIMDAGGTDTMELSIRDSRYFIPQPSLERPRLFEFLYSELMAEVCRATIGPDVCLNWEQYVVKAAEQGKAFSWHQDSGYAVAGGAAVPPPGNTCWCALDDVDEANGTIYVLPYDRAGGDALKEHVWVPELKDQVGYFGDDPGDPIIVPAGSVVVFSTRTFHRSGFNTTDKMRRVYLAQYGSEPLVQAENGAVIGRDEPFLKNGEIVAQI